VRVVCHCVVCVCIICDISVIVVRSLGACGGTGGGRCPVVVCCVIIGSCQWWRCGGRWRVRVVWRWWPGVVWPGEWTCVD